MVILLVITINYKLSFITINYYTYIDINIYIFIYI